MANFQPAVALTLQHEGGFFHNTVTPANDQFGRIAMIRRGETQMTMNLRF